MMFQFLVGKIEPYSEEMLEFLGNELLNEKKYRGAINSYTRAIVSNTIAIFIFRDLGTVILRGFQKINPNMATYYRKRGLSFERLLEYDSAIEDYQRAIELEPFSSSGHFVLGLLYYKIGRLEEAALHLQQGANDDLNGN